jgi:hypothetical protein
LQNFDNLINAGSVPWVDNSTLPGWYATENTIRASDGNSPQLTMFSFGTGTDRALGARQDNSTGEMAYGVRLVNNSGKTFQSMFIDLDGEQWRKSADSIPQVIKFMFIISNSPINSIEISTINNTEFYEFNFISPVNNSLPITALDGNLPANRYHLSASIKINFPPGYDILLKWLDPNDKTVDHGMGIDNLNVVFSETMLDYEVANISANFEDFFNSSIKYEIIDETNLSTFTNPDQLSIETWGTGFEQTLDENYSTAASLLEPVNYKLIQLIFAGTTYIELRPVSGPGDNDSFYFINKNPLMNCLALQVPHPLVDTNTPEQASYLVKELSPFILSVSGHNRCMSSAYSGCSGTTNACGVSDESYRISDPAHSSATYFQKSTEILNEKYSDLNILQLHGFAAEPGDPNFIISNGTRLKPGNDLAWGLGELLSQTLPSSVYPTPSLLTYEAPHKNLSYTKLIGTHNIQGRLMNNYEGDVCSGIQISSSVTGKFTHLEQYNEFRTDKRNYPILRDAVQQIYDCNYIVLAVELEYFHAYCMSGNDVFLEWKSLKENNHSFYTIEESADRETYYAVATFNSNAENNGRYYSYVREDISVPTYFRLRQTDIYGVSETYNPVYVDCNLNDSEILIYPNPSNGKVTLANLVTGTPIIIQNLKGEILTVAYARSKEEIIDLNSFPSGVYLIRIRDGKNEEIYRLTKQ